jgi:hypothetical protein
MATTLNGSPSRTAVSSRWLIRPPGGPRLVLVHRPEGVMGYTHSHRCWVVIIPVRGMETSTVGCGPPGRRPGRTAPCGRARSCPGRRRDLIPPKDLYNHGHVSGSGPSPYSLILLGDDMLLFNREEYDPEQGPGMRSRPAVRAGTTADLQPAASTVDPRGQRPGLSPCLARAPVCRVLKR